MMQNDSNIDKIVLIGGGGHCKSVIDSLLGMNKDSKIVITDPEIPVGTEILGCRVVGTDDILGELKADGFNNAFITVGSVRASLMREKLIERIAEIGFLFPIIIDPSSVVSGHAVIGQGTFIGKNAVVNADAIIGNHCIINTGAIIEHECVIGDYSHISVGAVLSGAVKVGKGCMIGAGSTLIQGITIGNGVTVGANSTVLDDVADGETVVGLVK